MNRAMTPEDLVEIELIKQLKYKYQRILDLHEFDEMRTVLTADVVARYGDARLDVLLHESCVQCPCRPQSGNPQVNELLNDPHWFFAVCPI